MGHDDIFEFSFGSRFLIKIDCDFAIRVFHCPVQHCRTYTPINITGIWMHSSKVISHWCVWLLPNSVSYMFGDCVRVARESMRIHGLCQIRYVCLEVFVRDYFSAFLLPGFAESCYIVLIALMNLQIRLIVKMLVVRKKHNVYCTGYVMPLYIFLDSTLLINYNWVLWITMFSFCL